MTKKDVKDSLRAQRIPAKPSRRQKRQKSAGPLLLAKEKIMKDYEKHSAEASAVIRSS